MACHLLNRNTLEEFCVDSFEMDDVSLCEAEATQRGEDWVVQCFAPQPFHQCGEPDFNLKKCRSGIPHCDKFCYGIMVDEFGVVTDPPDARLDRRIVPCCSQDLCGANITGFFRDCSVDPPVDNLRPNVCWSRPQQCKTHNGSIAESWKHRLTTSDDGSFAKWSDSVAPCGDSVICDSRVVQRDTEGFCTTVKRIEDGGCAGFGFGCWDLCLEGRFGSCCFRATEGRGSEQPLTCQARTREFCRNIDVPCPREWLECGATIGSPPRLILGGQGTTCFVEGTQPDGTSPPEHWEARQHPDGSNRIQCRPKCEHWICRDTLEFDYSNLSCNKRPTCLDLVIPPDAKCCLCGELRDDIEYFDCLARGGNPVGDSATTQTCLDVLNRCNHDEFGFAFRENHQDADGNSLDLVGDLPTLAGRMQPVSVDTIRLSNTVNLQGVPLDDLGNCRYWYGWVGTSRQSSGSWSPYVCNDLRSDGTGRRDEKQEGVFYAREDGRFGMLVGSLPACDIGTN